MIYILTDVYKMIDKKNFSILRYISLLYLGWSLSLYLLLFFGLGSFPHFNENRILQFPTSQTNYWINFANWDGGHFRGIAENGYKHPFQVVFFPLYPILIKFMLFFNLSSLASSLIISHVSTLIALFYLYKLVNLDFKEEISKKVIFLFLIFPTSFYLISAYSESLFLSLTISSFYFSRIKKWRIAALLAGMSAITRLLGLIVIFCVALEYYLRNNLKFEFKHLSKKRINRLIIYLVAISILFQPLNQILKRFGFLVAHGSLITLSQYLNFAILLLIITTISYYLIKYSDLKKILSLPTLYFLISLIPFILYALYLRITQNDFFAYVKHERYWSRAITYPWEAPINFYQTLSQMGFLVIGVSQQLLIEFLFFVIFLVIFLFSLVKLRPSYNIFFAIALLLPISTGTLQAIHRYLLVAFPIFIVLATVKNKILYQIWIIFSAILLSIFAVMFFNGYWVT